MADYYLIRLRPTPSAGAETVGCLRFPAGTTYDQRQASLAEWRRRPLRPGEYMWLDPVKVEDAPPAGEG